ncbi:MAG: hypothetical protein IJG24_02010 [Selenomonadaceae bacterium]|nr:hypothetical protein [Selenomonadaceae bacterium]
MAQKNFADAMNQIVNGTNGLKSMINVKADKNSPALTGTPTAPTPGNDTDSGQIATTEFCQNLIRRLVGSAPETLNTLAELATAINQDPDFAETIVQALDNKLNKTDAASTYLKKTDAATSSTFGAVKIGSNITNSSGTISLTKSNVTSALGYTPPETAGTSVTLASGTGTSTTQGMTQKAITDALDNKADSSTVSNKLDKSTWDYFFRQSGTLLELIKKPLILNDTTGCSFGADLTGFYLTPDAGSNYFRIKPDGVYWNGTKITN